MHRDGRDERRPLYAREAHVLLRWSPELDARRRAGLDEPEILAALREVNNARCRPPLDDGEVATIAQSVCRYEPDDQQEALPGGGRARRRGRAMNQKPNFFQRQQAAGRGFRKRDEEGVRDIKRRLEAGDTAAEIARAERVSAGAVYEIKSGRNWAWVKP